MKLIDRIKLHDWYVFGDIMTVIGPALIFIIIALLTSCSVIKEIPVQTIEKIEYRDSLIFVHDTVDVPVPYEVVKEVLPDVDTSYLQTSVASSVAYIDTTKRQIHHELTQKGHLQAILDTVIVVEYVDKVIEKEVPVEVIKEVKHIPNWCWINLIYSIIITLLVCLKIYLNHCQRRL
jgi:hypothetical protein